MVTCRVGVRASGPTCAAYPPNVGARGHLRHRKHVHDAGQEAAAKWAADRAALSKMEEELRQRWDRSARACALCNLILGLHFSSRSGEFGPGFARRWVPVGPSARLPGSPFARPFCHVRLVCGVVSTDSMSQVASGSIRAAGAHGQKRHDRARGRREAGAPATMLPLLSRLRRSPASQVHVSIPARTWSNMFAWGVETSSLLGYRS